MRNIILLAVSFLVAICVNAQSNDFEKYKAKANAKFASYKAGNDKKFSDYRAKVNAQYADFMRKNWEKFTAFAGDKMPSLPEPPKPVVKKEPTPVPTKSLSISSITELEEFDMPEPSTPLEEAPAEMPQDFIFSFHNTPCKVHLTPAMKYSLAGVDENSAAQMWQFMSENHYDYVADDCLDIRQQLSLNDWGYIQLVKELSNSFYAKDSNESAVMQHYILTQSGYKSRIMRTGDYLVLSLAFANQIYNYSYITIGNDKFYIFNPHGSGSSYYVYNNEFEGEKKASIQIKKEPIFYYEPVGGRNFTCTRYPQLSAQVRPNKNLIEFYDSYPPSSNWNYYSEASLSKKVKRSLYPMLKKQIKGKSQEEAANMLINFVQTAFEYATDDEQFGYERPLFGDEIFFYPYSDCEDRSILYSILVRDLLGLDVVLLYYPGHLATAVKFTENINGYYLMIENEKYLICDPTYIGAPIGDCMPQYQTVAAEIIKI